jgi:hypothetical protein
MKIHDELRNELTDSAARIDPGPPPTQAIVRRGRRRHAVRRISIVLASIGIAALAIVPLLSLAGLLGNRAERLPAVSSPGQTSPSEPVTDATQNVLRQTVCEVPGGTGAAFELTPDIPAEEIVADCEHLWRTGDFGEAISVSIAGEGPEPHTDVPPLVACAGAGEMEIVAQAGAPSSTCASLGLSLPTDAWRETAARWVTVDAATHKRFPGTDGSCVAKQDATDFFLDVLAANGFTAWTVEAGKGWETHPQRECASFAIDFRSQTVTIVADTVS